jgi:hypothetical protein
MVTSTWQTAVSATGLSLRALARETGISHTYLRKIIAGCQFPSEPVRLRLLDRFKGYRPEDLFLPPAPACDAALSAICKNCSSPRTIKSGLFQGSQRYQCKDCGYVFIAVHALLFGRLPVAAAVSVMETFFAGEPLISILEKIQQSYDLQITLADLEKMVRRLARKAVKLAGDVLPEIHGQWVLDGSYVSSVRPVLILDILDMDSGFIIASGVVRHENQETEWESLILEAVRLTGITPDMLILGPGLISENTGMQASGNVSPVVYNPAQEAIARKYADLAAARTLLLSRLSHPGLADLRLFCASWRVHYNYLGAFKPLAAGRYQSWLDIINAAIYRSKF